MVCLLIFAWCLTVVDAKLAGRACAAYGGVYIASSLPWLRIVEGVRPDRWDAAVIVGAPALEERCARMAGLLLKEELRTFATEQLRAAWDWRGT